METQKLTVELEVPKEAYELAQGLMKFGLKAYEQLSDGVDYSDVAPLIESARTDLIPGLVGVDQLSDEFKENKVGFSLAFLLAGSELLEKFLQMKTQKG